MERMYTTNTSSGTRRPKWQYPQAAPTLKILHLPRRPTIRRKSAQTTSLTEKDRLERLETLFDQERSFNGKGEAASTVMGSCSEEKRRERVEEERGAAVAVAVMMEEEKWRFQAEMLRAECNLLRMEKEIAVKKMERRRLRTERTITSAIHILLNGRQRICEDKTSSSVLKKEIEYLIEKLDKLLKNPRVEGFKNCGNFDKHGSFLKRRLNKFDGKSDELCLREIQEMAEASLSIKPCSQVNDTFVSSTENNMENLGRKMEALSKGFLLERMEKEYSSILSTANTSAASSVSSSKRIELPDTTLRHKYKDPTMPSEEKACSGRCKAVVKRIVRQVRAETEQWSQMQEMLAQVRDEMEELQSARDFWEDRALDSDCQIEPLRASVNEWRHKALLAESKANQLQEEATILRSELQRLREELNLTIRAKKISPILEEKQCVTEKKVLICSLKQNNHAHSSGRKMTPLREIGNLTSTTRPVFSPRRSLYKENKP